MEKDELQFADRAMYAGKHQAATLPLLLDGTGAGTGLTMGVEIKLSDWTSRCRRPSSSSCITGFGGSASTPPGTTSGADACQVEERLQQAEVADRAATPAGDPARLRAFALLRKSISSPDPRRMRFIWWAVAMAEPRPKALRLGFEGPERDRTTGFRGCAVVLARGNATRR